MCSVHLLGLRDPLAMDARLPAKTRDVVCAGGCDEQVAFRASLPGWRTELDACHEASQAPQVIDTFSE